MIADALTFPLKPVAVTIALPECAGAVNRPRFEIEPSLADQLTPVLPVFLTVAVNCNWPLTGIVAVSGVSDIDTWGPVLNVSSPLFNRNAARGLVSFPNSF